MVVVNLNERMNHRPPAGARPALVAALDVGSTKITCLIAERLGHRAGESANRFRLLGFGLTASRGIKCGAVANVDEAEKAIRVAVDAAEKMAQRPISDIYVNVSGGRPSSSTYKATVKTRKGLVSPADLDHAVATAVAKASIGKRSILHLSPVSYSIDGVATQREPLGLNCENLGVEINLLSVEPAYVNNINNVIERAHLQTIGAVIGSYAAARAVLVEDELELGSIIIDLGGAVTSIGVFSGGRVVAADALAIGGSHVTHDVARGLSTTIGHAERLKTLYGNALTYGYDERELLSVPMLGEHGVDSVQRVPRSQLTGIIRPRVEEILEMAGQRIAGFGPVVSKTMRIVLTGGGASMPGIRELAKAVIGHDVRVASGSALSWLPEHMRQPAYAVAAGLICYGASPDKHYALPAEAAAAIARQNMGYVRRVGRWFLDSF
jgi:cell division protein FtsA